MRKGQAPCDRVSRLALSVVPRFRPARGLFKPRAVQRALCGAARAERERGRLHRLRPDRALRLRRLGKLGSRTLPRPARLPYGRVARRGDGAHGRRRYSPRRGARRDRRLSLHLAACDLAARDGEEPASSCPRSNRHRRSSVPEEAERLVRQLLHRRGAQKYRCSDFTDPRRGRPLRPAQNGV